MTGLQARHLLPLLLLPMAGCGGGGGVPAPPAAVVRDSAGVRIVENRWSEAPAPGWRVADRPLFSVGGMSGDPAYEFTAVRGGAVLSDGRVAVMDGALSELRIYSPAGVHLRTLGRKGSGPEEFQSPALAGRLPGDTLVVFDSERRWLTLVHPDGGFGRSFILGEEAGDFVNALGLLGNEALAFGGGMFFSSDEGFPQGLTRPNSTYGTVALDGSRGMTVGEIPAAEMWAESGESGFRARLVPFGKVTAAAAGPTGFFLGTNEAWDIRVFDRRGALVARIRTDRAPAPITGALQDAYLEEQLAEADDDAARIAVRAELRDIPFPRTLPHYGFIKADAEGCLWVRDPSLPGEVTPRYAVFAPGGELLGTVSLPARVFPLEIGSDYVLGRVTDELDVESVALFSLERP
ncbi:MAG TPA: hypothetical protein VLA43_10405 [Longimicrobiales bacterium]|nr:hypothetical protein [Longimicrobiales bacterium]